MKRILIAPDKFKGSIDAAGVCEIISSTILSKKADWQLEVYPMADGGDGSLAILADKLKFDKIYVSTVDPLGRTIESWYGVKGQTAYIELAMTSGLTLLNQSERNPLFTSTYGTGLVLKDAIDRGLERICLMVGGSSTNDGGMGIMVALGYQFLDKDGNALSPKGSNLIKIAAIHPVELPKVKIVFLTDVNNPLFGKNGAAYVYGPQKGANADEVEMLDQGLRNLHHILFDEFHNDLQHVAGIGAAGAVATLPMAFLNAEIKSGIDFFIDLFGLEEIIKSVDFVITGEGRLDGQSFQNKVVGGIYALCQKYQKPLYVICGTVGTDDGFSLPKDVIAFPLAKADSEIEDAIKNPISIIERRVRELLNIASFLE
ncbi:MAG: glycerate kinase [Saprospiraceae bacterium]|nr:glycerate kinase [Saprospiraceae bacterium]